MPTFDFRCDDCSQIFEFNRPFGSTEMPPCPACASANIIKLITPPAVHFKGSGFYKTDNSTSPSKSAQNIKTESGDSESSKPTSNQQPVTGGPSTTEPKKEVSRKLETSNSSGVPPATSA